MSYFVECRFTIERDHEEWEEIAVGLVNGEVAADFQDKVDHFGDAAAELLEDILENHEPTLFYAEAYELNGDELTLSFEWPSVGLGTFTKDLEAFLSACGAKNVSFSHHDLSGD